MQVSHIFISLLASVAVARPAAEPCATDSTAGELRARAGSFSWDDKTFYVNDESLQIIGGQIDPQRVPRAYWGQRLEMAKAMGLNTIFTYLFWQDIEKYPGEFDFTGNNDVAAWFEEVQAAGLKAILRPGPYVCAERDWGGLPGWLSQLPDMEIRRNSASFLNATDGFMAKVGVQVAPYLVTNDGPILMVQIDNEYGYVGNDMNYKGALADILNTHFPDMKLYTNDGAMEHALLGGQYPGALSVIDGTDSQAGFELRDRVITDQSSLGPLMNGEYWVRWFDSWGSGNGHSTYDGDEWGMQDRAGQLDWVLSGGNHISIFMFHGGTSFGFGAGSLEAELRAPFTTSYDYGAALGETGRPSQIYTYFRDAISKYVSDIPEVPSTPPHASVDDFTLTPVLGLLDDLPAASHTSSSPVVMEATGQVFGHILYEHIATSDVSGNIAPGEGLPRDRIIVYVNGKKQGVLDGIYSNPPSVSVSLAAGDKLWLLVENLGRADNGFSDQTKGIYGDVAVGGNVLSEWNHYNFPLDEAPAAKNGTKEVQADGTPVWYRGTFATPGSGGMESDTFLQLPGGVKGHVFVNGINLGRYWTIGPQQELFVPGAYMNKDSENEVLVLELEPGTDDRVARGVAERNWSNNPDPDCPNCSQLRDN